MYRTATIIAATILSTGPLRAEEAPHRLDFYFGATGIAALDSLEGSDEAETSLSTGGHAGAVFGVDVVDNGLFFGLEARATAAFWEDSYEERREGPGFVDIDSDSLRETWSPELAFRIGATAGSWQAFGKAGAGAAWVESVYREEFIQAGESENSETREFDEIAPTAFIGVGGEYMFDRAFIRTEGEVRHVFSYFARDYTQYRLLSTLGVRF